MKRGHYDFEGGFTLKLRMRIDRNTAAIVAHAQRSVLVESNFNSVRMASHRFVHRIVENFCGEVVQGAHVCAANIHSWPPPYRVEPF
jgi:hypothetical protein